MRGPREAPADAATPRLTPRREATSPGGHEPPAARLVWVDWLRLLALAGVFVIHVCSVFDPWDEWHITNPARSRVLGEVIVLMAPWIMPLFMLLAGVSAWFSLLHRTNGAYVRERVQRLLIPLVVGVLVLVPPQVYLERRLRGQFLGSFWEFYPHFFRGIYPNGNLSWHHLWFLAHLFGYSLIALPLFRFWQGERGRRQLQWLARVGGGRAGLVWLALPLVLERHVLWWIFRERHMLTSDWSNHALLFVAFVYGFVLAGEPGLGHAIDRRWRRALVVACLTTSGLVAGTWIGVLPARLPPPYAPGYVSFWTLYAIGAWASMVAVLGAARRWLTGTSRVVEYCGVAGYAWYLVHQPLIVAVAYLVVPWEAPVPLKLLVLGSTSLLATIAVAELLRRTPVARRVLGLTPAPARHSGPERSFADNRADFPRLLFEPKERLLRSAPSTGRQQ